MAYSNQAPERCTYLLQGSFSILQLVLKCRDEVDAEAAQRTAGLAFECAERYDGKKHSERFHNCDTLVNVLVNKL